MKVKRRRMSERIAEGYYEGKRISVEGTHISEVFLIISTFLLPFFPLVKHLINLSLLSSSSSHPSILILPPSPHPFPSLYLSSLPITFTLQITNKKIEKTFTNNPNFLIYVINPGIPLYSEDFRLFPACQFYP